jgi:hypothetical protein
MSWLDWLTGLTGADSAPASDTTKKPTNRRGLTVAERRASRQRQLADLQERIALEKARAEVRALRLRGRPRATAPPSPIASVRETVEEALDLADSLRGTSRRDDAPPPPPPDAPTWERLLNSAAGVKLAETVAPSIAPMIATMLTGAIPTLTTAAPPVVTPQRTGPEAVPTQEEEAVSTNLIAAVVGFADRSPEQAAAAVLEAARAQAATGNGQLLAVVSQAARTPAILVRAVANRYRTDEKHGCAVARICDTPQYLDVLLRSLKALLEAPPAPSQSGGAF